MDNTAADWNIFWFKRTVKGSSAVIVELRKAGPAKKYPIGYEERL